MLLDAATGRIKLDGWQQSDKDLLKSGLTPEFVVGHDMGCHWLMTRKDWISTLESHRLQKERQEIDRQRSHKLRHDWEALKELGIPDSTVSILHTMSQSLTEEQYNTCFDAMTKGAIK
jgi:hypothetical protein